MKYSRGVAMLNPGLLRWDTFGILLLQEYWLVEEAAEEEEPDAGAGDFDAFTTRGELEKREGLAA